MTVEPFATARFLTAKAIRIATSSRRGSCSRRRSGANSNRNADMKCSWKFLLLVFLLVGFVISCSEPPNPRMAELQRYYALKGERMTPTIKKVEQRNTTQGRNYAPSQHDKRPCHEHPALGTTNVSGKNKRSCDDRSGNKRARRLR